MVYRCMNGIGWMEVRDTLFGGAKYSTVFGTYHASKINAFQKQIYCVDSFISCSVPVVPLCVSVRVRRIRLFTSALFYFWGWHFDFNFEPMRGFVPFCLHMCGFGETSAKKKEGYIYFFYFLAWARSIEHFQCA